MHYNIYDVGPGWTMVDNAERLLRLMFDKQLDHEFEMKTKKELIVEIIITHTRLRTAPTGDTIKTIIRDLLAALLHRIELQSNCHKKEQG